MSSYANLLEQKKIFTQEKLFKLPEDLFGTPTWPPFYYFGSPIWPTWRPEKTLYTRTNSKCLKFVLSKCSRKCKSLQFFRKKNQNRVSKNRIRSAVSAIHLHLHPYRHRGFAANPIEDKGFESVLTPNHYFQIFTLISVVSVNPDHYSQ